MISDSPSESSIKNILLIHERLKDSSRCGINALLCEIRGSRRCLGQILDLKEYQNMQTLEACYSCSVFTNSLCFGQKKISGGARRVNNVKYGGTGAFQIQQIIFTLSLFPLLVWCPGTKAPRVALRLYSARDHPCSGPLLLAELQTSSIPLCPIFAPLPQARSQMQCPSIATLASSDFRAGPAC